jgi:hypothetical protein
MRQDLSSVPQGFKGLHSDRTSTFSLVILVSWGGVRLSPLGTSATNWTIMPAPDDNDN